MTDNPNGRQKRQNQVRKTTRENNQLTGKEKFALWTVLKEAKGELEAERADMVKAAAMMTQRLGFKVTKHNIKEQLDRVTNGLATVITRLDALEQRLTSVEDIVLRLCAASGTGEKVEHDSQPMRAPDAWVSK
jgi:hypothetical protein